MNSILAILTQIASLSFTPSPMMGLQSQEPLYPWVCDKVEWVAKPYVDSKGQFQGTAFTHCTLTGRIGHGFQGLQEYLRNRIKTDGTIHEGPTPGTWEDLPSEQYLATITTTVNSSKMYAKGTFDIATDLQTKALFRLLSKNLWGPDTAKLIKKFDFRFSAVPSDPEKNQYRFRFEQSLSIQKPWYAPVDMFYKEVKNGIEQKGVAGMQDVIGDLESVL